MPTANVTDVAVHPGPTVRASRIEAGIKQGYLAQRVGISESHLSRFEHGKRDISRSTYEAIIAVLAEAAA
jgi:transcriptional regulator with XRE-family HTH domain